MKIVIDIPDFKWLENEEDFKEAVKEYEQGTRFDKEIRNALLNGTPLSEQHSCVDCISREATKELLMAAWTNYMPIELDINLSFVLEKISELPSVTPKAESERGSIGNNTDLETVPTNLQDWLSTFNTDSATECFTAVQELKRGLNNEQV